MIMNTKKWAIAILLCAMVCCGQATKQSSVAVVDKDGQNVDFSQPLVFNSYPTKSEEPEKYDEEEDNNSWPAELDSWYCAFPQTLKQIQNLIQEKDYKSAYKIFQSDSIAVVKYLHISFFEKWPLFFPEFTGLSEKSCERFRENSKTDMFLLLKLGAEILENFDASQEPDYEEKQYESLLNETAMLYFMLDDFSNAKMQINQLQNFVKNKYGDKSAEYATSLLNKGVLCYETGEKSQAVKFINDAKRIYAKAGMKDSDEYNNCNALLEKWKQEK
jgi:hypothetical protein